MISSPATIEQALLKKLRTLPLEKQQEVLDFAEFLSRKKSIQHPQRSVKGMCANLNIQITEEDITEARREMWGNFPREDIH